MEKTNLQQLIVLGKSTYKIADELKVSQTTIRYWIKKHGLHTTNTNIGDSKCFICSTDLTSTQVKYCSANCRQKAHYKKHKQDNSNTTYCQYKRGNKRKAHYLKLLGGACSKCGYDKNQSALHFHHNIGIKNFSLDMRTFSNTSIIKIEQEIKHCLVLCANCHAEHHYPQNNNWK